MKELYWLFGKKSGMSLENKILIYKAVIIPIWAYDIELWGCASKSSIAIIQRAQLKILRAIVDAPWYVTNQMIHHDQSIPTVKHTIQKRSQKHHQRLKTHGNHLLHPLMQERNN